MYSCIADSVYTVQCGLILELLAYLRCVYERDGKTTATTIWAGGVYDLRLAIYTANDALQIRIKL